MPRYVRYRKKLADFRIVRWNWRRQQEWKVSFAVLLLLAGAIYINRRIPWPFLVVGFFVYVFLWVRQIYKLNADDAQAAFFYMSKAEELVIDRSERRNRAMTPNRGIKYWLEFFSYWSVVSQMAVTGLLAFGVFYLIP